MRGHSTPDSKAERVGRQNTTLRFKTKSEVTLITMGVSPDLAASLRNLGSFASMGARTVKVHLKRDKSEDGEV